tara:strand:- start:56 stop:1276 length:1221 start_codon:yes stop_codon:yes gene_type:complete
MNKKSDNFNKTKLGGNRLTRSSSGSNSELNSELVTQNIEEINQKFKERSIKAKIFAKQNYLYIRGTFTDTKGIRKERKIPLRLTTDIRNLVSAEARILQLNEYVQKNGFIPDVMMWDTPRINPVISTSGGITIGEAIKRFEIDYWQGKKKTAPKIRSYKLIEYYLKQLPQDAELTIEVLLDYIIHDCEPESKKRDSVAQYFKRLSILNGLKGTKKFDNFIGKYEPKKRTSKDDQKLIDLVDLCRPNERYGWTIASQYIYGTRIAETYSLIPDLDSGTATSVCIPKGGKAMYIKYPIALTNELAQRWELDKIERPYTFDIETYDPTITKKIIDHLRRWLKPRAKEVGLEGIQPTDIRHAWGVRSILADMEVRTASKSMGHDPRTHFATYTQTYEQKDAKKQAKKYQK